MGGLFSSPSAPTVQTVSAPPEAAPPPPTATAAASVEEFTDEEVEAKKKDTKAKGTKALQIPLGDTGGGSKTIGVV